jgi:hypothetical protein
MPVTLLMTAVLLLSVVSARAQREAKRRPLQYIRTHKVLLLSDLITIGAVAAESVTSQECLNAMAALRIITSNCSKQGYWELKLAPLFIVSNHLAYHYAPAPELRYLEPMALGALDAVSLRFAVVNHNQTDWLWKTRCYPCFSAVRMPRTTFPSPFPSTAEHKP